MNIPGKVEVHTDTPHQSFRKTEFIDIKPKPKDAPRATGTIPPDRQLILLTPSPSSSTSGPTPETRREREVVEVVGKAIEISDLLVKLVEATQAGNVADVAAHLRTSIRAYQAIASINKLPPATNSALNYACTNIVAGEPSHQSFDYVGDA